MADKTFREGFSVPSRLGLSFDAWLYHPQIDDVANLAGAFPNTKIVLNHVGGPVGTGACAGKRNEVFSSWAASIKALASHQNVYIKVGGLGQGINGLGLNERPEPPSSDIVAATFRPYVETCIEAFGASRSMFESNFPVDKVSYSYPVSGTPASYLQRAPATQKKRICSPEPRRGFIASIQFSNSSEFNQAGAHKQVAVASGESGVQGSVRLFARSAAGCASGLWRRVEGPPKKWKGGQPFGSYAAIRFKCVELLREVTKSGISEERLLRIAESIIRLAFCVISVLFVGPASISRTTETVHSIYGATSTGSIRRSAPASSSVSRYNSPSGPCLTSRIRCWSSVSSGWRRIGSPFVGLRTMRCS